MATGPGRVYGLSDLSLTSANMLGGESEVTCKRERSGGLT